MNSDGLWLEFDRYLRKLIRGFGRKGLNVPIVYSCRTELNIFTQYTHELFIKYITTFKSLKTLRNRAILIKTAAAIIAM